MSEQWDDDRITGAIISNSHADNNGINVIDAYDVQKLMTRLRNDLLADLANTLREHVKVLAERDQLRTDMQSANRLLADCEENRGNLIAAVAELHAERDQLQITDHLMTQNYNTLNNEAQELRQQVAALTAERNRLDSAGGGSLAAGIAACWQEIAALKNERDQLQALLHSQISINNELQQELLAKVEQLQAMLTD